MTVEMITGLGWTCVLLAAMAIFLVDETRVNFRSAYEQGWKDRIKRKGKAK